MLIDKLKCFHTIHHICNLLHRYGFCYWTYPSLTIGNIILNNLAEKGRSCLNQKPAELICHYMEGLLTIFLQNSGDFDDESNGIKFTIFSTGKTHKKQKVCIVSCSFPSITVQTTMWIHLVNIWSKMLTHCTCPWTYQMVLLDNTSHTSVSAPCSVVSLPLLSVMFVRL